MLTFLHDAARRILCRTPLAGQPFLALAISLPLYPFVALFKRRRKMRRGERLDHLVLDWFFIPIRHHYDSEEIAAFMKDRGFEIEESVEAAGRFDSTSNFIFKLRRAL